MNSKRSKRKVCPICEGKLTEKNGLYNCTNCNRTFRHSDLLNEPTGQKTLSRY